MAPVVAVTGSTGFIGRRLVSALPRGEATVRPLTRSELELGDLTPSDIALATRLLEGVDVVCHVGAYIPKDHGDPNTAAMCMQVNALATLALLQASVEAKVRRFVYVSSGNVYRARDVAVTELDPVYPSARAPFYLASKVAGELYADHYGHGGRLSVAIARVSSVYGPGMIPFGLVPNFTTRLRAGQAIRVQDGGRYRTDLVHVDDVVDGIVRLVSSDVRGHFNIGAGAAPSTLEIAATLADLLSSDPSLIVVEPALDGARSSGFSALDITRARAELGYAPRTLRTGLRDYLDGSS